MASLSLPEPDERRLARSPLELVIFQVQYDTLQVDGEAALAIHAALGDEYPRLEQLEQSSLTVQSAGVSSDQRRGWQLTSADGAWIITVMPDHAGLETREFTTWEGAFRDRAAAMLTGLHEHVGPTVEQRVGLRFIDRIAELEVTRAIDWRPYLSEHLLGPLLHPSFGDAIRGAHQQILVELDGETRCGVRHGPVFDDSGRVDYLLDYDVFRAGGRRFDPGAIAGVLEAFNRYAHQMFRASVTDELLDALR